MKMVYFEITGVEKPILQMFLLISCHVRAKTVENILQNTMTKL